MYDPPLSGAVQVSEIEVVVFPAILGADGAAGALAGITLLEYVDALLVPAELIAETRNV
jgi:hypothetical protein